MGKRSHARVAIIGAGVVGIAIALRLQSNGFDATLVDYAEPGTGCSAGNAGVIASSFILPLSSFSHIVGAPRMLLDKDAPLSIPPKHLVEYAPWLMSFAANALPKRRRHSIDALKFLNGRSLEAWHRLIGPKLADEFIRQTGMLDIVAKGGSCAGLRSNAAQLVVEGIAIDELNADDAEALEPALKGQLAGANFHRDVAHVTDPLLLSRAMVARFLEEGGCIEKVEVHSVLPTKEGVELQTSRGALRFASAVIAAGWWSSGLVKPLGLQAPLRAERGYHAMLPASGIALKRPVSFHEESFLATPMSGGLRLAGTVELSPPNAKPNWLRSDGLLRLARRYLPDLVDDGQTNWYGSRPSFADSLPAIGVVRGASQILYAFGHQHLGLTQAAVSADLIHQLIRGAMPENIQVFSLERFGRTPMYSSNQMAKAA
ncbi:MAG: FAD-dependent oxidoreductase [Chloroflexota bacterium]